MAMRTTVQLDDDVIAAVHQLRSERHVGLSEAINELVRRGLSPAPRRSPVVQRTRRLGLRVDVRNIADALAQLEGPGSREISWQNPIATA
jgi:Arc/MetJ family transcription regulator